MKNYYITELEKFNKSITSDTSCIEYLDFSKQIVTHYTTNDYYCSKYKNFENNHLYHIVKWIFEEDKANHRINLKCLDVGCAYGTVITYLKTLLQSEIYAIDVSKSYIGKGLIEDLSIKFDLIDIELQNLKWNVKFDKIIMTEVLEHFNFNPLPTLEKLYNALNDDGRLYISTPNSDTWGKIGNYTSFTDMPYPSNNLYSLNHDHHHHYDEREILELFNMAKFKIIKSAKSNDNKYFNFILSK